MDAIGTEWRASSEDQLACGPSSPCWFRPMRFEVGKLPINDPSHWNWTCDEIDFPSASKFVSHRDPAGSKGEPTHDFCCGEMDFSNFNLCDNAKQELHLPANAPANMQDPARALSEDSLKPARTHTVGLLAPVLNLRNVRNPHGQFEKSQKSLVHFASDVKPNGTFSSLQASAGALRRSSDDQSKSAFDGRIVADGEHMNSAVWAERKRIEDLRVSGTMITRCCYEATETMLSQQAVILKAAALQLEKDQRTAARLEQKRQAKAQRRQEKKREEEKMRCVLESKAQLHAQRHMQQNKELFEPFQHMREQIRKLPHSRTHAVPDPPVWLAQAELEASKGEVLLQGIGSVHHQVLQGFCRPSYAAALEGEDASTTKT